jgi:hypothetical protein
VTIFAIPLIRLVIRLKNCLFLAKEPVFWLFLHISVRTLNVGVWSKTGGGGEKVVSPQKNTSLKHWGC